MTRTAHSQSFHRQLLFGCYVQFHCDEAQSDVWAHPLFEHICRIVGLLLYEDMDQITGAIETVEAALYEAREYCVIQISVVATSGIPFSGGFGSYLFGMSERIARQSTEANNAQNIKNPALEWMIGFLLVVSFLRLFSLVPLRKETGEGIGKFFSFSFL